MDRRTIGNAGLQGWRANLADKVARPVGKRTPLREDDIRSLVGLVFLVLTIVYVINAVRMIADDR